MNSSPSSDPQPHAVSPSLTRIASAIPQQQIATMATAPRGNQLRNYSGRTGNDKSSHGLTQNLTTSWQTGAGPGIWNSGQRGSFTMRDGGGSMVSSNDGFPSAPPALGAVGASDADGWTPRPGRWSHKGSPGNTSGSTSPSRTRDDTVIDTSNASSFYSTTQPQVQPPIGQRGNLPGRTANPVSTLDPPSRPFGQFRELGDARENGRPFGSTNFDADTSARPFRTDKHGSQDSSYHPSILPPSHSDAEQHAQSNIFGDPAYAVNPSDPIQSRRPSMASHGGSFSGQMNSRSFMSGQIEDVQQRFARMAVNDLATGSQNGNGSGTAYSSGPSQAFQFNPSSQPWDNQKLHGNGIMNLQLQDAYAEPLGVPYANRPGQPEQGTLAGKAYHVPIPIPRSYGGTPQTGIDSWPRPASREPRVSALAADQRNQSYPSLPQHMPPYYAETPYPQDFQSPTPLYHPYPGAGPSSFRQTVPPITGYHNLPGNPFYNPSNLPLRPHKDHDPAKGARSALMEQFLGDPKASKTYTLKHIYNHVVEFSGDQAGSRFIQHELEKANSDEKGQVFKEIEPNAVQLAKDIFGNYVIQKFFDHGSQLEKKVLIGVMKGMFADLAVQTYACRVVQKVLEHALVEQQAEIVKELEPDIAKIIENDHGNHVIQKVLLVVPRQYTGFIMDCLRGKVFRFSTNQCGCRVVQKALERGTDADYEMIVGEIHASAETLAMNAYGNYVLQCVIKYGKEKDREQIAGFVASQLCSLSKGKHSSNVVEQCFKFGTSEQRQLIREELIKTEADGSSRLRSIMRDQYGNYVIQTILKCSVGEDRDSFVRQMKPELDELLKEESTSKQINALDRLIYADQSPGKTSSDTLNSTAPTSPALHVDVNSPAPTPNLTTNANSPSSSPPSTNASAVGEAVGEGRKGALVPRDDIISHPEVRINDL